MPADRDKFNFDPEELSYWGGITSNYKDGSITDINVLPKIFCGHYLDSRVKNLSDFFMGAGFIMVSQRCADVFKKFDLGHGGFSPVEIYHGDRKTLATTDPFYILYVGCQKQAFLPEFSNLEVYFTKITVRGGYERYSEYGLSDYDCALASKALEGPDLWIDLTVSGSFFMSNRLVEALQAAKLTKNMFLRKCKVIE